jgi:hypothetical protein
VQKIIWFENRESGGGIRPDHVGSNDDLDPVCWHFLLCHSRAWLPREESRTLVSGFRCAQSQILHCGMIGAERLNLALAPHTLVLFAGAPH